MNKSSLADKIYNTNRSAFGSMKDIIFEGRELDLKFLCDCRCHLKIDKSKAEYVFNDEDRLIFAIKGQNSFFDDFCKCDREIGEYMRQTFRNTLGSFLSKSTPIDIKGSLSSSQSSDLEKGFYKISQSNKNLFSINKDLFWKRVIKESGFSESEFHRIREAAGLKKDKLEGDKIFTPSKRGINTISVRYKSNDLTKISNTAEERLKCIVLYYNAMYNKSQREIVITDTKRTPQQQAYYVYKSVKENGGRAQGSMYPGYSGMFVEQELKKGTSEQDIKDMLAAGIDSPYKTGIRQNVNGSMEIFTGFNHVNAPNNTADIGILNSNTWAKDSNFIKVLYIFMASSKFLNSTSAPLGKGNEKECHHLVILT